MKIGNGVIATLLLGVFSFAAHSALSAENVTENTEDSTYTSTDTESAPVNTDRFGGGGSHGGGNYPGHGGNYPGHGGNYPGHGGNYPGHGGYYPGHGGYYPGHGGWGWPHWGHPGFIPPVFSFEWARLHTVTCTAEDAAGRYYPVTENRYFGFDYQERMTEIEEAALDRCYAESGGDNACTLVDCVPGY